MTELCDIATRHGTDKAPWCWGYTTTYFEWLDPVRQTLQTVLEIGVLKGQSLRTWKDFFPAAMVYGVDNAWGCMVEGEDRIKTFCCDAYDRTAMTTILEEIGPIDFFVDDAVHSYQNQADLLKFVWPHMRVGGICAIEEGSEALREIVNALPDAGRADVIPNGGFNGNYCLALVQKGEPK